MSYIKTDNKLTIARLRSVWLELLALNLMLCGTLSAQSTTPGAVEQNQHAAPNPAAAASDPSANDYKVGPGDVLSVTVADAPEFGGRFRVTDSGVIQIVGVSTPIVAEGRSPIELSQIIRQSLIDAKQLRDPKVNVFVDEYRGRTVTVLGAVAKPAVYPIAKRTTVLDALSAAGGALPGSGNTVTIIRGAASAEATGNRVGSVQIIDMSRLVKGQDLNANVEVQNGDVISVSTGEVVYVVGAVVKPGGFPMPDPSAGVSVIQALAMAQGSTRVAATNRALIIRQSTSDAAHREILVNISQMISGKETDMLLAPNDILYLPESGAKRTLKVMFDIAMAAANGAAIYGVGFRAGGVNP
jgi:polysaccharide biosynthesis/export protein